MRFGPTTVTFVKTVENLTVRDRYNNPEQTITQTDVPGCLFRPFSFKESSPVATQRVLNRFKCTAPPVDAVINIDATDEVIVDGVTYQVVAGPEVFYDFNRPYKCTVYCDLQIM